MTITFAEEPWTHVRFEIASCWVKHHAEVADAEDRGAIPLSPDFARYDANDRQGKLLIIVARDLGEIAGYVFAFVDTHLHYSTTLCGFLDLYWVDPKARGHWVGVRMMKSIERALINRGVVKIFGGTKRWLDASSVFERCGWKETERLFTKRVG